jgi:hypothetical protein
MKVHLRSLSFGLMLPGLLLLVAGAGLLGLPVLPDEGFGWGKKLGVLFIALFFTRQSWAFGNLLLSRILGGYGAGQIGAWTSAVLSLGVGSCSLATLILLVGLAGALGPNWRPLYVILLLLPDLFRKPLILERFLIESPDEPLSTRWRTVLVWTLAIGILAYLADDFSLKAHGDVFTYHLSGPRIWFDLGRIQQAGGIPIIHQTGLWDVLYLWGVELLSGPEGRGLVAVQHFSQWIHVLIGYGGSFGALYVLFMSLGQSQSLSLIAALAGVSAHQFHASYAKNEWGAVFWVLTGLALWEWGRSHLGRSLRILCLAGFVLGCGFAAKWTTLFLILPWMVFRVGPDELKTGGLKPAFQRCGLFLLSFVAGMAPIALRNWFQVGNPFFPTFNRFFGSPHVIPSFAAYLRNFEGDQFLLAPEKVLPLLKAIFSDTVYPWGVLLIPFFVIVKVRERFSSVFVLSLSVIAGLVLFLGKVGASTEPRLAGPLLVLLNASSVVIVLLVIQSLFGGIWKQKVFVAFVFLVLLLQSNFPMYAFPRLIRTEPSNETLPKLTGGRWKKWVREHIPLGSRILHADCEYYYLLGYQNQFIPETLEYPGVDPDRETPEDLFRFFSIKNDYLILESGQGWKAGFREWVLTQNADRIVLQEDGILVIRLNGPEPEDGSGPGS